MTSNNSSATLIFADSRWRSAYKAVADDVQYAIALALTEVKSPTATLNVLFTNNDEIQQLNRDFRAKNKPTNVLSFPSGEEAFLGDIAISYDVIAKEKAEQSKTWRAHTLHMVLHGTLHLLGYDHENDEEAEEMEAFEIALLEQLGVANPYE